MTKVPQPFCQERPELVEGSLLNSCSFLGRVIRNGLFTYKIGMKTCDKCPIITTYYIILFFIGGWHAKCSIIKREVMKNKNLKIFGGLKMKKLTALLLIAISILSICSFAFAEGDVNGVECSQSIGDDQTQEQVAQETQIPDSTEAKKGDNCTVNDKMELICK